MMNTLSTMSIFVAILLSTIGRVQLGSVIDCGPNEIKVNCGPVLSCQPSCSEPNGTACPRLCAINACICKEGFVRDNHHNFQCIELKQCIQPKIVRPSTCGPNEVESECALLPTCQPSCDNPRGTHFCAFICSPCVCKEGFIRHSKTNLTCIEKTQCHVQSPLTCATNEEYNRCANLCQASCDEPNRQPCPTLRCSEGCVCSPNYLRATNETTSPCIRCEHSTD